jgi:spermidine synthase
MQVPRPVKPRRSSVTPASDGQPSSRLGRPAGTLAWVFVCAYGLSGFAGLIYQTTWTRMMTLWMGHTTAASSTVVSAFMGGLGIGALAGGRIAARLTPRQALLAYVALEAVVALLAAAMPFAQDSVRGRLASAYQDGTSEIIFPLARLASSLALVFVPALALGATFTLALRWFCPASSRTGRCGGALYAANTIGAAGGVVAAGFFTIPALGVSGTTRLGIAASMLAMAGALFVARRDRVAPSTALPAGGVAAAPALKPARKQPSRGPGAATVPVHRSAKREGGQTSPLWLGVSLLAISGCLTMMFEIAWVRVLALLAGPTTYAFAATVAAVIVGLACGSAAGSWLAGRTLEARVWLGFTFALSALATTATTWFVGTEVPRRIASAAASASSDPSLAPATAALVATLILPTAFGLGIAFPLTLQVAGAGAGNVVRGVGAMYFANTLAAAGGALAAGFVAIPGAGLQTTLHMVSALLVCGAALALGGGISRRSLVSRNGLTPFLLRAAAFAPAAVTVAILISSPPWNRDLLSSGVYRHSAAVRQGVPLEAALQAGTLLYYEEGASGTVSVRELAGERSMAIDGKVDASTGADMLTQKALAHLPLLLHPNPRDVLLIGLGSGVTLASALTHPVGRVDVVEISPEVVEASKYFGAETGNPLDDPRARLVVADGRSHLHLSSRAYDVIVSEPSNPWMIGVAALFTTEFFLAARDRLAPGGIICQWAHTYNITDLDLRSIAGTFRGVFPNGTMWLIGTGDLLFVASNEPLEGRLANLRERLKRPGVRADLETVSASEPFALLSLFAGGPRELQRYAAGAPLQTDDRMPLEFSGPRAVNLDAADANARNILDLGGREHAPPEVLDAFAGAGAREWRNRGTMMLGAEDYVSAFDDYRRALALDSSDEETLRGLTRAAVVLRREGEALDLLRASLEAHPRQITTAAATARLLAARGEFDLAFALLEGMLDLQPGNVALLEGLASILADTQDVRRLTAVVTQLERLHAGAPRTSYYAAVLSFLQGDMAGALTQAREAARRDPSHAAAHNLMGVIHASLQDEKAAREAFQSAARLDPRDRAVYENLGLLELTMGNRSAAAGLFAEALVLDPRSSAAREGLERARQER